MCSSWGGWQWSQALEKLCGLSGCSLCVAHLCMRMVLEQGPSAWLLLHRGALSLCHSSEPPLWYRYLILWWDYWFCVLLLWFHPLATKSSLLQRLQVCPKGTVLFGQHHNHPGRKFPFSVVMLEIISRFVAGLGLFSSIRALARYFFLLKNSYLLDTYKDGRRIKFSKFRLFAFLIGAFPMLCQWSFLW